MVFSNEEYPVISRAIGGDTKAYEELIIKYNRYFYKIAYFYVQNQEDALDVVQESVYTGLVKIRQLKQPEKFVTWMNRIVVNNALKCVKQRRKQEPAEQESLSSPFPDLELRTDLFRALNKIQKRYRDVIILKYFYDKSIKEISMIMHLTESNVKTCLFRGKNELRKILKEDYFED